MTPFLKILSLAAALVAAPAFALAADPPAAQTAKPGAAPAKPDTTANTDHGCPMHDSSTGAGKDAQHSCAQHMGHGAQGAHGQGAHGQNHHHHHDGHPPADQPKPKS